MTILFVCGSAEPGKDGVGDYTRRFCGELFRKGINAEMLSLCDHEASSFIKETQFVEGCPVVVRRIPIDSPYEQRLFWTQSVLNEVAADWISLQFVPYSFHFKGLPFWLPEFLKKLKGKHQWHFMFHELWIGIERDASFKKKCVGIFQKAIIRKLKKTIDPSAITTQAKIYQYYLSKIKIQAQYLPLFGNVAVTGSRKKKEASIVFVVFATIYDNAPFEQFILDLKTSFENNDKELKFVFIGRHGTMLPTWTAILEQNEIEYELLGSSSEEKISEVVGNGDYGISSTPYKISDKSGVVAAMREHQLKVMSVAKPWVDQDDIKIIFNDIINYKKGTLDLSIPLEIVDNSLSRICDEFLKIINK